MAAWMKLLMKVVTIAAGEPFGTGQSWAFHCSNLVPLLTTITCQGIFLEGEVANFFNEFCMMLEFRNKEFNFAFKFAFPMHVRTGRRCCVTPPEVYYQFYPAHGAFTFHLWSFYNSLQPITVSRSSRSNYGFRLYYLLSGVFVIEESWNVSIPSF